MTSNTPPTDTRAAALFRDQQEANYRRTDRLFAGLMVLQFIGGIVAAFTISPLTWSGEMSSVHVHVWAAVGLGGLIASLPIGLAIWMPGRAVTRHVIACAQLLFSGLLIHLTGGRIETHFHIFGSLAFLGFYRDWRVFIGATLVTAVDHLTRAMFWPESVFGVLSAAWWRPYEHIAWVAFEDVFLIRVAITSAREMRDVAEHRANLEAANATVEEKVHQLGEMNETLEHRVAERTADLEKANRELGETARRAGMAEVATGVLHNVGNVLNSVNVSADLLRDRMEASAVAQLTKAVELVEQHRGDLPEFIRDDERGRHLPEFLVRVAGLLNAERDNALKEIASLNGNLAHMKEVVAMQQTYAKTRGVIEFADPTELFEDALKINQSGLSRHEVDVERHYEKLPPIQIDRHRCIQTLVNLISNAKHVMTEEPRLLTLTLRRGCEEPQMVEFIVTDTGCGIEPENLSRVFQHGFTTRQDGHGFGLHTGALCAKEMHGQLTAHSDGPGRGATFILRVPSANAVHREAA